MTPTKLSDSDKSEILRLYRQSDENTITLAKRYGVSSSTVRRILQSALSDFEYESLVHQKQKRLPERTSLLEPTEDVPDSSQPASESDPLYAPMLESPTNSSGLRRHSLSAAEPIAGSEVRSTLLSDSGVSDKSKSGVANLAANNDEFAAADELKNVLPETGMLAGEDFSDFDDGEDEEDDDDADLDDFDGEDLDEADSLFAASLLGSRSRGASGELRAKTVIQVLPLSEASIPKICYLVVDRAAELIVRPLKAFGELGQIPPEEIREKTLPVFDNHRVARRFSTRNQRVCKVPDGRMLQKTAHYLQAKGITRLLIDGQVYSTETDKLLN
ncbi:MAG: hypothetical protein ACRC62_36315 [Microcoleus sp.]